MDNPWLGPIWFVLKVQLLISVFVWLRGTLPRLRYDQFMNFGWKVLIEVSLLWIIVIALFPDYTLAAAVILVAALVLWFGRQNRKTEKPELEVEEDFDPFAGGYPVPPMPGQVLPELVGVVHASEPAHEEAPAAAAEEGKGL